MRKPTEPEKRRTLVTNSEITRALMEKGWEIRYRGGNEICSTPSDLEMIIADAPESGEATPGSSRPRYSIAAWPSNAERGGMSRPPSFDLYDAEQNVEMKIHRIPTPEQAAQLLEQLTTR